jgi:IS30 family transposase
MLRFFIAELDLGRAQPKPSTEGRAREGHGKLNSRSRKRLGYKTPEECYVQAG